MRVPDRGEEMASEGRSLCAFCAEPLPEPGKICCADYANTLDDPTFYEPSDVVPEAAPAQETPPRARFLLGSQFLVGLLVSSVGALALLLVSQARIAEERAEQLDATRRLSEEMIALMRETRRAAPNPAVAPEAPAGDVAGAVVAEDAVASAATSIEPAVQAPAGESAARPPAAPAGASSAGTSDPSSAPDVAAAAKAPVPASPANSPPETKAVAEVSTEPDMASRGDAGAAGKADGAVAARDSEWVWLRGLGRVRGLEKTNGPKKPARSAEPKVEARPAAADPVSRSEPSGPEAEARIRELAALAFPARREAAPPPAEVAIEWTKIEQGMSRREVEALLGEPRWVQRLLNTEFWLYADRSILGRGWVAFSDRGVVMEWSQP